MKTDGCSCEGREMRDERAQSPIEQRPRRRVYTLHSATPSIEDQQTLKSTRTRMRMRMRHESTAQQHSSAEHNSTPRNTHVRICAHELHRKGKERDAKIKRKRFFSQSLTDVSPTQQIEFVRDKTLLEIFPVALAAVTKCVCMFFVCVCVCVVDNRSTSRAPC
eukprot:TRINITY_DN169_c0_g1_i3.p2 TRINITY_DN169_c0_g1~~TRINITY_DN169_c0_g1_i3.p2  ORF type:complete len:163 (+),score=23.00 TRINITY_DN169_c0_g1_i3:2004-2492(+)